MMMENNFNMDADVIVEYFESARAVEQWVLRAQMEFLRATGDHLDFFDRAKDRNALQSASPTAGETVRHWVIDLATVSGINIRPHPANILFGHCDGERDILMASCQLMLDARQLFEDHPNMAAFAREANFQLGNFMNLVDNFNNILPHRMSFKVTSPDTFPITSMMWTNYEAYQLMSSKASFWSNEKRGFRQSGYLDGPQHEAVPDYQYDDETITDLIASLKRYARAFKKAVAKDRRRLITQVLCVVDTTPLPTCLGKHILCYLLPAKL